MMTQKGNGTTKQPWLMIAGLVVVIGAVVLWLLQPDGAMGPSSTTPDTRRTPVEHEAPTEQTQVNWIGHWLDEDLRETIVREVAEQFDFEHPEITVNLVFPQQILGKRSKPLSGQQYAEMIRSGKIEWDIIWLDDYIYRYTAEQLGDPEWGKKYLVDFEQVPGFVSSQKDFIINDPAYRNQTGGVLVGPYLEGYYFSIWYNKDVAQRLGLEIKDRGMTFDDLLGYVKRVHEYNETAQTPVAAIYEAGDWPTTEFLFHTLAKSEIASYSELFGEFPKARQRAILLKVFEALEQLGQYDPLPPGFEANVWYETRNHPLEDKCLFYVQGTWMYNHWRSVDKGKIHKMVPAEMPVFQPVNHATGGYIPTWAVMKDSPNREAAIQLLMAWCAPRVAERWVRYTKNPTGVKGNLTESTIGSDVYEQYQAYMSNTYGGNVHHSATVGYLLGEQNAHLQEQIKDSIQQLLTGKTTAQEACDRIMGQCQ